MDEQPVYASHDDKNLTRYVAATGLRSSARPARKMGDAQGQVSWLTAQTHPPAFPPDRPAVAYEEMLAAYSCGGSRRLRAVAFAVARHCVPFSSIVLGGAFRKPSCAGNEAAARM